MINRTTSKWLVERYNHLAILHHINIFYYFIITKWQKQRLSVQVAEVLKTDLIDLVLMASKGIFVRTVEKYL